VRARVPAAGRSGEADAGLVEPLRDRPFGLRTLALVLRIRLAAVSLTVKCPLLFIDLLFKQLPSQCLTAVNWLRWKLLTAAITVPQTVL
jgi:hypothetical protein